MYIRSKLAEHWKCLPWEVDEAPHQEVMLALALLDIEGKNQSEDDKGKGRGRPRRRR